MKRLDPRRHLAAAIGWAVFALVALASVLAAGLASAEAERAARVDAQALLAHLAREAGQAIDAELRLHQAVLRSLGSGAPLAGATPLQLQSLRADFPAWQWLAVVDAAGGVRASTDSSAQPWPASSGSVRGGPSAASAPSELRLGDAAALDALMRTGAGPGALSLQAEAAGVTPMAERDGSASAPGHGVWLGLALPAADTAGAAAVPARFVGGRLDAQQVLQRASRAWSGARGVSALWWDARGRLLAQMPPPLASGRDAGLPGTPQGALSRGPMLTDQANGPIWGLEAAPWRIELQQPAAAALAGVARVRRWVFWTVLLGGLAAALAAVAATRVLTRRLGRLAEQAVAVRSGRQATLLAPKGRDEVSRIGSVLADLVQHLQREKSALTRLNAELDQRVSDRTARIERMADEARHAAVTRERLRLARDLHDTLAHSLMALLTQVRLVRKLRTRMGPAELDAELQRAETVAVQGLAEARAAITRMRDSGAADAGLVSALKDLVARFGERSGCEAKLQADAAEADLTGERAEVVHRIVGEALRNVERHAGARQVRVTVGPAEAPHAPGGAPAAAVDRLCVTVADDGQGFDPAAARPGHYGLIGMREQASLIGADLHIDARPGAGTRVSLCFAL